jgi:hypothetical protein
MDSNRWMKDEDRKQNRLFARHFGMVCEQNSKIDERGKTRRAVFASTDKNGEMRTQ